VLPPVGLSHLLDKSLQANKTVELIYQFVLDLLPSNLLENEFFFYGFVCVHNLFSSSKKKIKLWSYERRHAIMHAFALSISFGM